MAKAAAIDADPHRRALLGKVHVARKQLALDDDTYRGVLLEVTGHMSAKECSTPQLKLVVDHFKHRGFQAKTKRAPIRADHPSARKARALWISLHHLGAIENPSEKALEAFAKRQLKCDAFQWADQARCYKLIEALKAMAERHGWKQDGSNAWALKLHLCEALLAKLKEKGLAGSEWSLIDAAFRLCGVQTASHSHHELSIEELEMLARSFGTKLRGEPV